MINFHPYYIQERPVRSIIIINIIVIVVVIIIYYCYRIIVISCPHYLCVVWLVSITQQKKRFVQLAVLSGWHYQDKSKFFLNFILKNCLKLSKKVPVWSFLWQQHYSHPSPPLLSILKLWFNFILGLNFIFFFFNSLSYITIPKNLSTLEAWEIACQGKQRCQPRLLILETLYFSLSPSPRLSTARKPPLPVGEINQVNKILTLLCAAH